MTSTAILIPARFESTRFPGKPLVDLKGKSMITRVIETCKLTDYPVYVLTDHMDIAKEAIKTGVQVILEEHIPTDRPENGTERCAQAVKYSPYLKPFDYFINVQGDMPDITDDVIKDVASDRDLFRELGYVVTAYTEMDPELLEDPNTVKCVPGKNCVAWFGRGFKYGKHHIGIYGYSRTALNHYLDFMSNYEHIEKLEQLRWIENDIRIKGIQVAWEGIEINTPEDAKLWNNTN